MRPLGISERLGLPGLDDGRADIILAGLVVVIRILHVMKAKQMKVSMSDLLEGLMMEIVRGDEDE